MGRTQPPPGTELRERFTGYGVEYSVVLAGVAFGQSAEECIAYAWEEYDRITLPARVALLRELAAEMESKGRDYSADALHRADKQQAIVGYAVGKSWQDIAADLLGRADALETGTKETT